MIIEAGSRKYKLDDDYVWRHDGGGTVRGFLIEAEPHVAALLDLIREYMREA